MPEKIFIKHNFNLWWTPYYIRYLMRTAFSILTVKSCTMS
jgi:hypothetical protein